jgi:hypothetical protein
VLTTIFKKKSPAAGYATGDFVDAVIDAGILLFVAAFGGDFTGIEHSENL